MLNLAPAKSETEQAFNIVLESATLNDRSFPGVGNGNVSDLKISLVLVGYSALDIESAKGFNKTIKEADAVPVTKSQGTRNVETQVAGPILLSTGGFIKNNNDNWELIKETLKLGDFSNDTLISLFKKTSSKLQRIFYVSDINETERFISLFLPLFNKVN